MSIHTNQGTADLGLLRPTDAGVGDRVPFDPHPNLQDLIAAHHEAEPDPIDVRTSAVTPKGEAVAAVYRLKRLMAGLSERDYLDVAGLVIDELGLVNAHSTSEPELDNLALCERCGGYDPALAACPYCTPDPARPALSENGVRALGRVMSLLIAGREARRG